MTQLVAGEIVAETPILRNRYGYFVRETREFVITDIKTPRPWINVLANEQYGLVLSQAGGGFSWAGNCQLFRLSRWEQDLVQDAYGRFLYVQDLEAPSELWSTSFQPTRRDADVDIVRHRLGSTVFERRFMGLETRHTVFVPQNDCAEVWIVEIRNLRDDVRNLRLGSYLEWQLGGIGEWHREFHRLFMETRAEGNTLLAWKHAGLRENRPEPAQALPKAFMSWSSGTPAVQWITDKESFLGRLGSPSAPEVFARGAGESAASRWDDPIAGSLVEIQLQPGESRTFVLTIGSGETLESCLELAARYDERNARLELERVTRGWKERCEAAGSATSDEATDVMVNGWLPYQAIAGRLYARCAYYQQGGAYGFRDQLQDSLMLLDSEPAETIQQLRRHAEAMYEDGGVRHWWHPGVDIFVESHHSDTCLWLAYGTLEYLDATGDQSALECENGFLSRESQVFGSKGTLREHCERGIERALSRRSPRGLPLIGAGDWNDGLSHAGLEGRGESVWLAMFLFHVLGRWAEVAGCHGDLERAKRYRSEAESLRVAVETYGWDGEWYIQGTRDDGRPIGSHANSEGMIFLNPQTWAVISGIASPERVQTAMESVRKQLLTPYGALLLRPAFSHVDAGIGYISRYAPGLRENGGVYSHASTWAALAFSMIGDDETAKAVFQGMLPPLRAEADADLYAAEPYVMPGNVDGPASPYEGRAGWTWYTGSAAWMVRIQKKLKI